MALINSYKSDVASSSPLQPQKNRAKTLRNPQKLFETEHDENITESRLGLASVKGDVDSP